MGLFFFFIPYIRTTTASKMENRKLSNAEKKHHHNLSEQKRREQLRQTYDKLVDLVPSLSDTENRSELIIMNKSVEYVMELRREYDELVKNGGGEGREEREVSAEIEEGEEGEVKREESVDS